MKTNLKIIPFLALSSVCIVLFQNCDATTYSALPTGDQSSSSVSSPVPSPTPTTVVCGGIGASDNCDSNTSAVQGEIFYMNAQQQADFGTIGVDTYFDHGTKVNATILLDQLFVPTTLFSQGFATSNSATPDYLKDENGNLLVEYFALRLKTKLSLTADDGPGLYQLALISDDGARVIRTDTGEEVVDGDGTHSSMLSCGHVVNMQAGQSIPIDIDYYQGPRYEIALTFMWRKVASSDASALSDPLCNIQGNGLYFGNNFDDYSAKSGYGQLLQRGWSVVPKANLSALAN